MKHKRDIVIGAVGLLLTASTAAGLWGWQQERQHVADLEAQIAELQKEEKRSAVVRSVSKQMEEIAYQQKEISDEQREEAIQQTRVANEMRHRSEVERQNALAAQEQAVLSEHQAQQARLIAEEERQTAEHQRIQAELSKRMTDTLSFTALGRSLGSLSSIQAQLGNKELADLLAYSSYVFTNRYKGDVYYPAVFQSLLTASESKLTWACHNGLVMGLAYESADDNSVVTVSTYGEIMLHKRQGDKLQSTTLLSDKTYDFRDAYIDDDIIYAVSRSGHLIIIKNGMPRGIVMEMLENPSYITSLDDNSLLLVGERGLAVYDKQRDMIVATRELDFHITASSRYDNMPLLFDDQGHQHLVKNINEFITSDINVPGRVTAFASSKNTKTRAYGMSDGTIYLYDEQSEKTTKLQGHLSRISKIRVNGHQLYSASYDGTMKLWNTASEKIEPMTLLSAGSWIMSFTFDRSKKYAWIGDQNGNVTEALLSVPTMVDIVSHKLKRNFTTDEWNYYIGRNVPYEKFK